MKIKWNKFDKNDEKFDGHNIPFMSLCALLIREEEYDWDNKMSINYHIDLGESHGNRIDGFWNAYNDWDVDGVHVVAYAIISNDLCEVDRITAAMLESDLSDFSPSRVESPS